MKRHIIYLIVFAGITASLSENIFGVNSTVFATAPRVPEPFIHKISFLTPIRVSTPTLVDFRFAPNLPGFDSVVVAVSTVGGLLCEGESGWTAVFKDRTLQSRQLTVTIPPNDTSGLVIRLTSRGLTWPISCYFATTRDTVETYPYRPRSEDPWLDYRKYIESISPPGGTWTKIGDDSVYIIPQSLGKGDTSYKRLLTAEEIAHDEEQRKLDLECTPETLSGREILVSGEPFIRHKGEYKFQKSPVIIDHDAYVKNMGDSLTKARAGIRVDIWLDLRDSAKLNFAKTVIDTLIPSEILGIYHALVRSTVLDQLRAQGVEYHQWRGKGADSVRWHQNKRRQ